ncbi:MAG TPA: hypothetical protein VLJ62_05645 [Burkholderiaceae bacterium]|nr:hypothetical protein [Burkholderiaceae bacterium]
MTTDLRGFSYALEPLLRRQRWALEAAQSRLGLANREIAQATHALSGLQEQLADQNARAAQAATERMDPVLHRRSLQWLADMRQEIARAQQALDGLREQRSQLMAVCAQRQNKLDVIERHRDECRAVYAQEHDMRAAAAADRDWLARRPATRDAAATMGDAS